VSVDDLTLQQTVENVLPLAVQHAISSYDAAYLELALRKAAPLATLDAGLARAARAAGVEPIGAS
jgi:predicted nucleic acid-binding protein